jgi:hypothetical protein
MGWIRRQQQTAVAVDAQAVREDESEFEDSKFSGKGVIGAVQHIEVAVSSVAGGGQVREDGLSFIDPEEVKRHCNRKEGYCV